MTRTRAPGRPPGPPAPRRRQILEATVDLIAGQGYGAATLGHIADAAGLSKASVLHYFGSVARIIEAAQAQVIEAMAGRVARAVEAAPTCDGPAAYIEAMVEYFREHPGHTRMLTEATMHGHEAGESRQRWEPVVTILTAARQARGLSSGGDLRQAAIIIGGAINAIVAEQLDDPDFDGIVAARELSRAVGAAWLS